jgi:transposase-like protein
MIYKCRGCSREFDVRRGLTAHKRYCPKVTDAVATSLAKRRHNEEIFKVAKVRHEEEAEVLRARQDIREGFAEPELVLAVCSLILHVILIFEVL